MRTRTIREHRGSCGLLFLAGAAAPLAAHADLVTEPYVAAQVEHDDNVFRTRNDTTSDTLMRYAAGGEMKYDVGQQQAFVKGEFRKFEYDKLDDLDYKGHFVQGGWNWKLGSVADGVLRADNEKRLESFASRTGTDNDRVLGLTKDTTARASANIRMSPKWELRLLGNTERLRNTLDTSETLDRNENLGTVGIGYLGLPISSMGFEVGFGHGNYPHRDDLAVPVDGTGSAGLVKSFDQRSYLLTALWRPSGISTVEAKAGYTKRDNDGVGGADVDDYSGFTGRVNYLRTVSAKTTLNLELFREVESIEFVGESSVARTGVGVGVSWKPTPVISVDGSYRFGDENYQGASDDNRKDKGQFATLTARYQMFRYVYLVPAVQWEKRGSNDDIFEYDDFRAMLGLELRYRL